MCQLKSDKEENNPKQMSTLNGVVSHARALVCTLFNWLCPIQRSLPASLTSSRPAPPSPAVSRRASGLEDTTPPLIHIRDYGFPQSDPRFTGQGPNVPRPNRPSVLARRLATTDDNDNDNDDDDDERTQKMWHDIVEDGAHAWRGFKWGGFRRAWGVPPSTSTSTAGFPSRGDLDRNFGGEDPGDDEADVDMQVETDDPFADEQGYGSDCDPPLSPGLYRALYPFEPEGTAEMRLDQDQLVHVVGRGGGVGWAVVVKDGLKDTGLHALVPESYLELVRPDGDEDLDY